jgi:hypothetical protein
MTIDEVIVIVTTEVRVTDIISARLGGSIHERDVSGNRMSQFEVLNEVMSDVIQVYVDECPWQKHNMMTRIRAKIQKFENILGWRVLKEGSVLYFELALMSKSRSTTAKS